MNNLKLWSDKTYQQSSMASTKIVGKWKKLKPWQKGVVCVSFVFMMWIMFRKGSSNYSTPKMVTEPFLQLPTLTSINVVWFTNFQGQDHYVSYGKDLGSRANATSKFLPKLGLWRHEVTVSDLKSGEKYPYVVTNINNGELIHSSKYTLSPSPSSGKAMKILLTSDHQGNNNVAIGLQKAVETEGPFDAVFYAGDTVMIPDDYSGWFGTDRSRGAKFFPCLQGRAEVQNPWDAKTTYRGGEILQNAPIFTSIGNHDVMGRTNLTNTTLSSQFSHTAPRWYAEALYKLSGIQLEGALKEEWLANNSFNLHTYEDIFTLPEGPKGERYYATSLGDVRLVVLFASRSYRQPTLNPEVPSRFHERKADLNDMSLWSHGEHIFEPIAKGTEQYKWLESELASPEFKSAKYKIVMLHHPPHTLGINIGPPFAEPHRYIKYGGQGEAVSVTYEYPKRDGIVHDVVPLLSANGVQLMYYGHSHVWNRFKSDKLNFLEASNIGISLGAFLPPKRRPHVVDRPEEASGDPYGLKPVVPTLAPLNESGSLLPFVDHPDLTLFSVLDTGSGTVRSYYYNVKKPDSKVVKFDEFKLEASESSNSEATKPTTQGLRPIVKSTVRNNITRLNNTKLALSNGLNNRTRLLLNRTLAKSNNTLHVPYRQINSSNHIIHRNDSKIPKINNTNTALSLNLQAEQRN
eukprot:NODE_946_length_2227_cov_51.256654_g808_i0.p1 GENE.NODE_946_length_2227_cov_51.256654_g808_i0~~NODE_946_length_2227_cov_51.256654_g808_i0.p1  ORF type:complete len:687 (-),score=99.54 NODE_946_length_2227_cov_51.256654_g808_i0:125-2185(-)